LAVQVFADGALFGEVYGETPQVIALHGWARSSRDFGKLFSIADENRPALSGIAFDLPGFGNSPPFDHNVGSAEYAELVASVISSIEKPIVLVGHSFGGRVAIHIAAIVPDKVKALVLTGVPLIKLSNPKPKLSYKILRKMHHYKLIGDNTMEKIRRQFGSSDYAAASPAMRQVLSRVNSEDYRPTMTKIGCQVELLWGENDMTVSLAVAHEASTYFKSVNLTICRGISHLLPTEDPVSLYDTCVRVGSTV
jgi:pimeloyl-ACP methyl ester carboxylesterase